MTTFAIKGSKRIHSGDSSGASQSQGINTRIDLVQIYYLEKALGPVIKHMRKESDDKKRQEDQGDQFDDELTKMRKDLDRR